MLICKNCGDQVSENDIKVDENNVAYCRVCNDYDITEAKRCPICNEWYDADDGVHICECCLDDAMTVGNAIEFGAGGTTDVEVNGLFYALLSEKEINDILTKYVEEHYTDYSKEIVNFCNEHKHEFADFVAEKGVV